MHAHSHTRLTTVAKDAWNALSSFSVSLSLFFPRSLSLCHSFSITLEILHITKAEHLFVARWQAISSNFGCFGRMAYTHMMTNFSGWSTCKWYELKSQGHANANSPLPLIILSHSYSTVPTNKTQLKLQNKTIVNPGEVEFEASGWASLWFAYVIYQTTFVWSI